MSEIRVVSTTAMKSSLDELAPIFERESGHTVAFSFGPSQRITRQVSEGAENDITITSDHGLESLITQGRIVPGTRADLTSSAMALAVQKGAKRPDISSAEKFKETLLAAKSLGMSNPVGGGQSGKNLIAIFDRLGITEQIKAKATYGAGGPTGLIGLMLLRNEVEIGIQQLPELIMVPGIDVIGPLPPDIQSMTVFSAGLSTAAKNPDGAKALIKFLTTPTAKAAYKSKGLDVS